jgi:hypothetical protein
LLANIDLLADDIELLRKKETEVASERQGLEAELRQHVAEGEHLQEVARSRQDAEGFKELLSKERQRKGRLPECVLRTFFERVVNPLDQLVDIGIRLNRIWPHFDYGQLADRSGLAAEIIAEWRGFEKALPQLIGDLKRLRAANTESVLPPEDAIRLAELNRRLQDAQQAMVDDASKVTEWQAIQKEIREIKRQGAGLDRSVYSRIFNAEIESKEAHLAFTDPTVSRIQVIAQLEKALSVIQSVHIEVASGITQIEAELEYYIQGLIVRPHDKLQTRRLEGSLRNATSRENELAKQRSDKESRLLNVLNQEVRHLNYNKNLSLDSLPQIRAAVANQIEGVRKQLDETRMFRDAWEPILTKWVAKLSRPETVRSDQINFLQHYVRACNVVGVTCTENRRSLDSE